MIENTRYKTLITLSETKTKPPADDKYRADEDDGPVNVYTIDP